MKRRRTHCRERARGAPARALAARAPARGYRGCSPCRQCRRHARRTRSIWRTMSATCRVCLWARVTTQWTAAPEAAMDGGVVHRAQARWRRSRASLTASFPRQTVRQPTAATARAPRPRPISTAYRLRASPARTSPLHVIWGSALRAPRRTVASPRRRPHPRLALTMVAEVGVATAVTVVVVAPRRWRLRRTCRSSQSRCGRQSRSRCFSSAISCTRSSGSGHSRPCTPPST
mmetsp:Transcript_8132/g.19307  ORF Transcript_8132/g.19307 Transcript_8132/m.19307 type:complete len:232 (-) Transcript_8132:1054-1749(-)